MFESCIVKNNFINEDISKKISNRKEKKACFVSSLLQKGIIKDIEVIHPQTEYLLNSCECVSTNVGLGVKQLYLLDAEVEIDDPIKVLEKLGDGLIFIDNIYKNKQATENWMQLRNNDEVTLCINFYHFGILSANKDFTKQNFTLKF